MPFCTRVLIYLIKNNQQKHRRKSAEQKPGLSYAVRRAQVYTKGLIIPVDMRPQASISVYRSLWSDDRMINPFVIKNKCNL